jgi:hypothetical protein
MKFEEEVKEILTKNMEDFADNYYSRNSAIVAYRIRDDLIKKVTLLAKKTALECLPKEMVATEDSTDAGETLIEAGEIAGFNEAISQAETKLKEGFK